jgi:hypothetical protein
MHVSRSEVVQYGGILTVLGVYTAIYRLSWGSAICPMYFFMAGTFRIEFFHNSEALGDASYSNLSTQYDYYSNPVTCMAALLGLGLVYKILWLLCLRWFGLLPKRVVLQKVYGARRKARRLIRAGLRWREGSYNASLQPGHSTQENDEGATIPPLHNGIFEMGDGMDDTAEVDFGNSFHVP